MQKGCELEEHPRLETSERGGVFAAFRARAPHSRGAGDHHGARGGEGGGGSSPPGDNAGLRRTPPSASRPAPHHITVPPAARLILFASWWRRLHPRRAPQFLHKRHPPAGADATSCSSIISTCGCACASRAGLRSAGSSSNVFIGPRSPKSESSVVLRELLGARRATSVSKKPTRRHGMVKLRLVRSFPYPSTPRPPSWRSLGRTRPDARRNNRSAFLNTEIGF